MRAASTLLFLTLAATAAAGDPLFERPVPYQIGEMSSARLDSSHPYAVGDPVAPRAVIERLQHPGATYMVVSFARLDLAPGDELRVRDEAGERVHRYFGQGPRGGDPFWSFSVPGDTAVIEIVSRSGAPGWGWAVDGYEHGFRQQLGESTCAGNDKQAAQCYMGSHPTHYQNARAVASVRFCGAVCTGSIISCDNHFITNDHCRNLGGCPLGNYEARFDYERPCGGGAPGQVSFGFQSDVRNDAELDYWLVQLDGDAVAQFGHLRLDPRPLNLDEVIYIPQHPGGRPKEFGIDSDLNNGGVCRIDDTNRNGGGPDTDTGYFCDTEGGSSGSPVLAESSHRVVALHHFGTGGSACAGSTMNAGVRMERIDAEIRTDLPGCSYCSPLAAAGNLQTFDSGMNRVDLTWDPVGMADTYEIWRADGGCGGAETLIGTSMTTSYADTTVSDGVTYGYRVRGVAADGCEGGLSACRDQLATGDCIIAPAFVGVDAVRSSFGSSCAIDLDWSAAVGGCSTDVVYNIYRDVVADFVPDAMTNLLASCVSGSSYSDTTAAAATRYFYVVRAEDRAGVGAGPCAGGIEDANLIDFPGRATDGSVLGTFLDSAEGAALVTVDAPWQASSADARVGSRSYRVPGTTSFTCASLTTPPLVVSPGSVLGYAHREDDIEVDTNPARCWDGGTVELSLDLGATWTRLEPTPGYARTFVTNSNSCNNDRLGGGCHGGNSFGSWTDATVDLSAYAGREVQLRLVFATDDAVTSTFWYVDEIVVSDVSDHMCGVGALPWRLFRATVASVAPGWKAALPLPLEPASAIDVGFPRDFASPGSVDDLGVLADPDPLMVYRLLDDADQPVANQLYLIKSGLDVVASH